MREEGESKNRPGSGDQDGTVKGSVAQNFFGIVEESVDARILKTSLRGKEEVTVEPAKVAEGFVDRDGGPDVKNDQELQKEEQSETSTGKKRRE